MAQVPDGQLPVLRRNERFVQPLYCRPTISHGPVRYKSRLGGLLNCYVRTV